MTCGASRLQLKDKDVLPTENLAEVHKEEGDSTVGTDPTDTTQQPVSPDSENAVRSEGNGPGQKAKKSADLKSYVIMGMGKQEDKLKLKDKKNSSETPGEIQGAATT